MDAYVASIGEEKFFSLADAIAAAKAGDTITFLADITEDVTVNKAVTIDGAEKTYTGTMTISTSIDLTVQNVNFVDGNIVKGNKTGTTGTYIIRNCDFIRNASDIYAIEIRGSEEIIIENVTSKGYYGFMQVPSSNGSTSIKNVTIEGTGYAIKVDYSNGVMLENVVIKNSTYGFVNSNFGTKTITVKGCTINATYPLVIWDRDTKLTNTFKFEGINDFGSNAFFYNKVTEAEMAYTKYVLAEVDATLTACADLNVTTDVADYKVVYEDGTYKLVAKNYVAEVNGTKYETLQEAIDACVTGDNTITLLADSSENVTIKQTKDVNVTIDGAFKTYSGTITIHGNARYDGSETLTIKNVKFVTDEAGHYFIDSNSTGSVERYAHNVKVDNCYFLAEGAAVDSAVGVRIRQGFNIALTRNESHELHSLFQGYGCTGFTSEGNRIMSGKNGISVGTSTGVKISDTIINVDGYGIRADGTGAYDMTVEVCNITAELPVVIRNATGAYQLTMAGKSTLNATNEDGYQVIFTNGDDGTYEMPTGKFEVTGANSFKVYPICEYPVAIGNVKYESLQAAIEAAKSGETIVILKDHEIVWNGNTFIDGTLAAMVVVANNTVTIDLNGFDLTVDADKMTQDLYAVFAADNKGHLTLMDSIGGGSVTATGKTFAASNTTAYSIMMAYEPGTSLTVKSGEYVMESAHDSLIYSGGDDVVTVEGGKFILGNVGDGTNGKPWIFNALGSNERNVTVTGGTFNADVNHQYWIHEVQLPKEKALVKGNDGMWTVVDAKAYIVEYHNGYGHNVGYATFADALAAAKTGETITLLVDHSDVVITIEKAVKLDTNGCAIGTVVLDNVGATVLAPADQNVITNIADHKVVYENGVYSLLEMLDITDVIVNGEYTYNGSEQTADITVKVQDIVLTADDYTVTGNVNTNAGIYTITVTGKGKYKGTATVEWTIAKKAATITVDNASMVEGNDLPDFTATVEGLVAGDVLNYTLTLEGTTITATLGENPNYDVTVVNGTLIVETCIATVDGVAYDVWADAMAAIKGDSVIVLYADITNSGSFSPGASNKICTLDLNGHKFTTTTIGLGNHATLHITDSAEGGSVTVTNFTALYVNGYLDVDSDVNFNSNIQINYHTSEQPSTGCFMVDGVKWIGRGHFSLEDGIIGTTGANVRIADGFMNIAFTSGSFVLNTSIETLAGQSISVGENATLTIPEDVTLTLAPTTTLVVNGTVTGDGTVVVNSFDQLKAILSTDITNIEIGSGITVTEALTIEKDIVMTGTENINANGNLTLMAGTYDMDVNAYCASGYLAKKNTDNTWTVTFGIVKNVTTGKLYADLADAVAEAVSGDTITLLKDIEIGNVQVGLEYVQKITIDLAGYQITAVNSNVALTARRAGTELTLKNGTVFANTTGGTLRVTYGGKLLLGENLTVNSGSQAHAIYMDNGVLEINGATVEVNGGIYCITTAGESTKQITITGGMFRGDLNINESTNCVITGGTFTVDVNKYCPENYCARNNGDGTWTVIEAVAYVEEQEYSDDGWYTNKVGYATFEEALAAADEGEIITIIANDVVINIDITKNVIVKKGDNNVTVTGKLYAGTYDWNVNDNCADNYAAFGDKDAGTWSVLEKIDEILTQVLAKDSLDMMFGFNSKYITNWNGYYIVVTRTYSKDKDGVILPTDRVEYQLNEWNTSGYFYTVTYMDKLGATDMCDEVTITIYDHSGNAVSATKVDTIQAYAYRMYNKATTDIDRAVYIDMILYGAAAQKYFSYGLDQLADSVLNDTDRAYASQTMKEVKNSLNVRAEDQSKYLGSNLIVGSHIKFKFAYKYNGEGMYAKITYTNHYGNEKVLEHVALQKSGNAAILTLDVTGLSVADARKVITITVYNGDGSEYLTMSDSIESYCARMLNNPEYADKAYIFEAFMKFADSTYAFLHKDEKSSASKS